MFGFLEIKKDIHAYSYKTKNIKFIVTLIALVLVLSGCSTPLMEFQAKKIGSKYPRTISRYMSLVSDKVGEGKVYKVDEDDAWGAVVLGTEVLNTSEGTLKSVCWRQNGSFETIKNGNVRMEHNGIPLIVNFNKIWGQQDVWLQRRIPDKYFGQFDDSNRGVCLTKDRKNLIFAYNSLLYYGDDSQSRSSQEMLLLITFEKHYVGVISSAKQSPSRRLYVAINKGSLTEVRKAIDDGAHLNRQFFSSISVKRPLHFALYNKNVEIARILMDSGAQISAWEMRSLIRTNPKRYPEVVRLMSTDVRLSSAWEKAIEKDILERNQPLDKAQLKLILEHVRIPVGAQICGLEGDFRLKGRILERKGGLIRVGVTSWRERFGREIKQIEDLSFLDRDRWREDHYWKRCE